MADNFVSFLVDQTLELQKKGERKLSTLELKLSDYELNYFKGSFIPQSQVLRFKTSFGVFDVPMNWSVFAHGDTEYTVLNKKNDPDLFFSVMKKAWGLPIEDLLLIQADGFCYLVGLKKGESTHLHDLVNPQEWLKTA